MMFLPVLPTHAATMSLQPRNALIRRGSSTPIEPSTLHTKRLIICKLSSRDRLHVGLREVLESGLALKEECLVLRLGVEELLTKLIRHMIIEE